MDAALVSSDGERVRWMVIESVMYEEIPTTDAKVDLDGMRLGRALGVRWWL